MLAAAALLWATSELPTLQVCFAQARQIVQTVFRWQPAPGVSAQGFLKMLGQWQGELLGRILPHLREQMQAGLPTRWLTAGYVLFGSMVVGWRWRARNPWKLFLRRCRGRVGPESKPQAHGGGASLRPRPPATGKRPPLRCA